MSTARAERRRPLRVTQLVHAIPDAALLVDDRERITAANDAFVELLGLGSDAERLAGSDCSRILQQLWDLLGDPEGARERVSPVAGGRRRAFRHLATTGDGRVLQIDYRPIELDGVYRGCLWICREVSEVVAGSIGLAQTLAPGVGAVLSDLASDHVSVYVTTVARQSPPHAQLGGHVPARAPAYRILVAEDDEMLRSLITMQLEHLGHHVTAVADGDAAMAQVTRHGFDAVLLDVHMEGRGGPEVARFIRALPSPVAQIPIAALTSAIDQDTRERCSQAGMDDFVVKPVTSQRLQEMLDRMIRTAAMPGDWPAHEPARGAIERSSMLTALATLEADLGHDRESVTRMVRAFVDGLPNLVKTITEESDADVRRRACHRLSGSAHTFGAHSLGNLAAAAEATIVPGSPVMATLAEELSRQASDASEVLESYLTSGSTMRYPMPRTVAT